MKKNSKGRREYAPLTSVDENFIKIMNALDLTNDWIEEIVRSSHGLVGDYHKWITEIAVHVTKLEEKVAKLEKKK